MSVFFFFKNQKWIIILLFFYLWWPFFKHRCPVMLFWRIWGYFSPKISRRGGVVFWKKIKINILTPLELFFEKATPNPFLGLYRTPFVKKFKPINKKVMVIFWFFKKTINVTPIEFFGKKLLQILQKDPTGLFELQETSQVLLKTQKIDTQP